MDIVIAGGHGKIAMHMHPLLAEKGHQVRALIRKPDQVKSVREKGAKPVICDLEKEKDLSTFLGNADAVVFAAGAGPGSGAKRKWTVDRDGALKVIDGARRNGINRFVMISAMGLDKPRGNDVFQVYQKAKAEADEALKNSGLHHTIVKPGKLTDDAPTGLVSIGKNLPSGTISRKDVADVLLAVLENPDTKGETFDLTSGNTPVNKAIHQFLNR